MMLAMSSRSIGRSGTQTAPSRWPAAVITLWILSIMAIIEPKPLAVPPKVRSRSPLGRMESYTTIRRWILRYSRLESRSK